MAYTDPMPGAPSALNPNAAQPQENKATVESADNAPTMAKVEAAYDAGQPAQTGVLLSKVKGNSSTDSGVTLDRSAKGSVLGPAF